MKKLLSLVIACLPLAALSAAAQSDNNGSTSPPKTPPFVGMTTARAAAYYGRPFTQVATNVGQRWTYRLKFDEVYGRALVPFYEDSENVRWGYIDFGRDGRARSFDWQRVVLR